MPDVLTHYTLSYLIASRVMKPKYAVLVAFIGLLPDIDALIRIHRWITHSLIPLAIIGAILTAITIYLKKQYLKYVVIALTLYTLHIIMDMFTAATPILWPITMQSYMINLGVIGAITDSTITITPTITVTAEPTNFTQQPILEGPIITPLGAITTIAVATIILVEYINNRQNKYRVRKLRS